MGDYNITLEARDSINRNTSQDEAIARRIVKEIMHEAGLKDCYRESKPTGGFSWQRGNTMSRLDMILKQLIAYL